MTDPRAVLDRLHAAQGALYAGGDPEPVRAVLTDDVVWHVPGRNAIAGEYRGVDAVMAYFQCRRDLAGRSFRLHPGELLLGDGEHVAMLTDGTALIDGIERRQPVIAQRRIERQPPRCRLGREALEPLVRHEIEQRRCGDQLNRPIQRRLQVTRKIDRDGRCGEVTVALLRPFPPLLLVVPALPLPTTAPAR